MLQYAVKTLVSAIIIVAVSEIARRSSLLGGLIASLPLTSVLAMIWLYHETRNAEIVAELSSSIFWLVLPSLVLFILLPGLLAKKVPFYAALGLACLATAAAYSLTVWLLKTVKPGL